MIDVLKNPDLDQDGMATYDYIVNHVDTCFDDMPRLVANLQSKDLSGQFLASSARFLAAMDRDRFGEWIPRLIESAIEKDRERRYIGSLLQAIWGADYSSRIDELKAKDDNFRRIYKRIYPDTPI